MYVHCKCVAASVGSVQRCRQSDDLSVDAAVKRLQLLFEPQRHNSHQRISEQEKYVCWSLFLFSWPVLHVMTGSARFLKASQEIPVHHFIGLLFFLMVITAKQYQSSNVASEYVVF